VNWMCNCAIVHVTFPPINCFLGVFYSFQGSPPPPPTVHRDASVTYFLTSRVNSEGADTFYDAVIVDCILYFTFSFLLRIFLRISLFEFQLVHLQYRKFSRHMQNFPLPSV
jgi:hypothetical protein